MMVLEGFFPQTLFPDLASFFMLVSPVLHADYSAAILCLCLECGLKDTSE